MMARTALSISILLALVLLLTFLVRTSDRGGAIDLGILEGNSLLTGKKGQDLPSISEAAGYFEMDFYSEVARGNGFSVIEGPIEMKTCCIPGSTGAYEHLLQIALIQGSSNRIKVFKGLKLSINGYCTVADASWDITSTVAKAEEMLGKSIDEAALEAAVQKVLILAHHRWYTGTDKGPKYYSMELDGTLGFTLKADPEALEIELLWPVRVSAAMPMMEALSEYDSITEADSLGIETIFNADFNALALEMQEATAEESSCVTTDTGTT